MQYGEPLRIIHCFRSPVGGIFRHVRDLAEQHSKAGHAVGIVCDSTTGGAHEDALFDQIMPFLSLGLTRIPIRRSVSLKDLSSIKSSYDTIKSLKPDVLHGHGAKGGVIARTIGSVLRVNRYCVARVYSPHGGSLHFKQASVKGQAVFLAERLLERMTDAILFVCKYEQGVYETKIGRPRCTARMIYNGISDRDLQPVATNANAADLIYVGMMRDLKGPDVFIRAFAEAERIVGRPLSARMVGDGPDLDAYDNLRNRLGLGERITMLPAMRVRDAFAMSRLVVVPSRAEAMPYIVLEALGAGKGVIASRVGGIPEVLGGDSKALSEPGNVEALARTMSEAITNPEWIAETMPTEDQFRSQFSASVMADRVLSVYRERLAHISKAS